MKVSLLASKKNSYTYDIKRLLSFIGSDRKYLLVTIFLMLFSNLSITLAPRVAGMITDLLSNYALHAASVLDMGLVVKYLLLLVGLYLFGHCLTIITNKIMIRISRNLSFNLRSMIQSKLHKLSINYLDTHSAGNIMARITNDMVSVEAMVESNVATLTVQILIMILVTIMMLWTSPLLSIIYFILVPTNLILTKFLTNHTKYQYKQQQEVVGQLNGFINDTFTNQKLIKSYTMENKFEKEFKKINKEFYTHYTKSRFLSGLLFPMNQVLNNLGFIGLCLFGAYLIIKGYLSIGMFLSILLYGEMLVVPLMSIANSLNRVQSGFSALERIFELLDLKEETDKNNAHTINPENLKGEIKFNNVKFNYPNGVELFNGISFDVEASSVIAIVGPSGAGKTSLINLLMRFYDINSGEIQLDNQNTGLIYRKDLRKPFGMVLQDSWIFDGTVAENIGYGKENATLKEIEEAAHFVGADYFINNLENGYQTHISGDNTSFSVGEKQLLVLARTVLANPKILILDEATSQMDTRTELIVTRAMEQLMKNRTTFVIAHHLYTIKNADKIVYMDHGEIKEVGNHEELIKLNGYYSHMYYTS